MKLHKNKLNIQELLEVYSKVNSGKKIEGKVLSFVVNDQFSCSQKNIAIYNPTKPISKNGKKFLLSRVESLASDESKSMFFVRENDQWQSFLHPVFELEDPFYIENVHGYQIIGGVKTYVDPNSTSLGYETVFYRYKNCATELLLKNGKLVKPFCVGPKKMKDIRLIELASGKIGIFGRPQGGAAGLGKISYTEIDNLSELANKIPKAKIIPDLFNDDEWGGANELHLLSNGKIGVVGHIAHYEGEVRHYYAMSFIFDSETKTHSEMKILATADAFPGVKSKNPTLGKVVFSGGIEREKNGRANLYVGVGDTSSGSISIADPFVDCGYAQQ